MNNAMKSPKETIIKKHIISMPYLAIIVLVVTIPIENLMTISTVGSITRLIGLCVFVIALLSILYNKKNLTCDAFHFCIYVFGVWILFSIFWSFDFDASLVLAKTYIQLFIFTWLLWIFIDENNKFTWVLFAFVFGCFVSSIGIINEYISGSQHSYQRFSSLGFNPNDLAMNLVIGLPIAFYLTNKINCLLVRLFSFAYIIVSPSTIFLTGSRTGFMGLIISIMFMLYFIVTYGKIRNAIFLLASLIAIISFCVPIYSWKRIMTLQHEITEGDLNARTQIWSDGFRVFTDNPIMGVGAGGFRSGVERFYGRMMSPHNTYLSVIVEFGIIGGLIFFTILAIVIFYIFKFDAKNKIFWISVFTVWLVASMSLGWSYRKPTWFIFGMIVVHKKLYRMEENASKAKN